MAASAVRGIALIFSSCAPSDKSTTRFGRLEDSITREMQYDRDRTPSITPTASAMQLTVTILDDRRRGRLMKLNLITATSCFAVFIFASRGLERRSAF